MIKKILRPRPETRLASLGLVLLRIVAGAAFVLHGLPKIQNPFEWLPHSTMPSLLIALAAASEFFGGICWILGLFTPLFSFLIACTMGVALSSHLSHGDSFVSHGGGSYELAALYLSIALVFLWVGPGRFSLDAVLFGSEK